MLLAASMMWPSEGAINGSGLHLAVLWLVAGVVAVWTPCTNRSRRFSAHGSPGWGLLIAGLWISTYFVFQAEGDRRAAVNLGFEWISVGVVWWLVSRLAAKAA